MALKAGRVGVAPDQVDSFGKVKSEATSGYTKQEADEKFETQIHAASTYETKSDAAALQPMQLSVPIELLSGSFLTVEDGLHGLASEEVLVKDVDFTYVVGAATGSSVLVNVNLEIARSKILTTVVYVGSTNDVGMNSSLTNEGVISFVIQNAIGHAQEYHGTGFVRVVYRK